MEKKKEFRRWLSPDNPIGVDLPCCSILLLPHTKSSPAFTILDEQEICGITATSLHFLQAPVNHSIWLYTDLFSSIILHP